MGSSGSHIDYFQEMPRHIVQEILFQLRMNVVYIARASQVCKLFYQNSLLYKRKVFTKPYLNRSGEYADVPRKDAELFLPPSPIVGLQYEIIWVDQGWGNQKGKVFFKFFHEDDKEPYAIYDSGQIAGHKKRRDKVSVYNADFINLSQNHDRIECHSYVGGGGGHTLLVEYFKVVIVLRNTFLRAIPST